MSLFIFISGSHPTMSSSDRIDEVVRCWADLYEKETLEYGRNKSGDTSQTDRDESEAFAQIFHSLVHSSPGVVTKMSFLFNLTFVQLFFFRPLKGLL